MTVADIRPHAMTGSAAKAAQPKPPKTVRHESLHDMSDADLADEHRGQGFAKKRSADRLAAIEAELVRRGTAVARGTLAETTFHPGALVDLPRLRAERPDICAAYAQPGGGTWRSRTLSAAERSGADR